jgi:hypothetical protein
MSNAVQIRDASDLTTYKKNRAIYQNYVQLQAKSQLPIGGIPAEHLMGVARTNATFIPTDSILANVVGPADCPTCFNEVEYFTTQVIATPCDLSCANAFSYRPQEFIKYFRS